MQEEELRDVDEAGTKSFEALDTRETTMVILGYRWWAKTAKWDEDKKCENFHGMNVRNVMSAKSWRYLHLEYE